MKLADLVIKLSDMKVRVRVRVNYKKRQEKSPGSATITNLSPSQTPRGRGNRQTQTSTNRINIRKAPRLALSSPSKVIAILKGLKTLEQNDTWKDLQQIAS